MTSKYNNNNSNNNREEETIIEMLKMSIDVLYLHMQYLIDPTPIHDMKAYTPCHSCRPRGYGPRMHLLPGANTLLPGVFQISYLILASPVQVTMLSVYPVVSHLPFAILMGLKELFPEQ